MKSMRSLVNEGSESFERDMKDEIKAIFQCANDEIELIKTRTRQKLNMLFEAYIRRTIET